MVLGKTTLLNVLAQRVDVGVVKGDRYVNGQALFVPLLKCRLRLRRPDLWPANAPVADLQVQIAGICLDNADPGVEADFGSDVAIEWDDAGLPNRLGCGPEHL